MKGTKDFHAMASIVSSDAMVSKRYAPLCKSKNWLPFKSKWEKMFAKMLTVIAVDWKYEPEYFEIYIDDKKRNWIPDFYLPEIDRYIEISTYNGDSEQKKKKIQAFREQHPSIDLIEIAPQEFENLIDPETLRGLI